MSLYTDKIRHWATDNRHTGLIANADGIGEVGLESSEAGRRLAVRFTLHVDLDRVSDARYQVFGCGFSMAACAVAADMAVGSRLKDLEKLDANCLNVALEGLPVERQYCADLAIEALRAAVKSAIDGRLVTTAVAGREGRDPRVSSNHPVYRALMLSPCPEHIAAEDRHLFACLLSVAADDPCEMSAALGLETSELEAILMLFFPDLSLAMIKPHDAPQSHKKPGINNDVLQIILDHVPVDKGFKQMFVSIWFARIMATRATLPGHLWVAMGLTARPQLTAAIRRHLPSLADANNKNMRWKRYLYKQVCDLHGGVMCKAPNCGVCSDYSLCFAEDE